MSTAVDTLTEQLIAELYTIEGKAEIVDGRIERMSPTGGIPGRAGFRICRSLEDMEARLDGYVYPDNVAFVVDLPNRKSFSPDAAFSRIAPTRQFVKGAPDFAAEVRSEGDYGPAAERKLAQKRSDYFAAGTQVVWDVDVFREDVIRVYRRDSPGTPTIYGKGQIAEAEPAVPGWTFPVNDLFE
jgi:Uma2 family endonuclease